MKYGRFLSGFVIAWAMVGCGSDTPVELTTGQLIVNGSSRPPQAPAATVMQTPAAGPVGDPASWLIGLYAFLVNVNPDCSGPFVTAFDDGGSPLVTDFTTNPELFRAEDVPIDTYPCVAMRISDVLEFQSAASGGACVAGVTYRGDIYRAGGEDEPFRDLSLTIIPATGTDTAPSEDGVYILFSTNRAAVTARGFAPNQVVSLSSPLVVPDAITFHWDATNAVFDTDTRCILEPDAPALFR